MKKVKKNLFTLGLAFSMALGLVFSFTTERADAFQLSEIGFGEDKIPCWSAGNAAYIHLRYVECAACVSIQGKPTGGRTKCTA